MKVIQGTKPIWHAMIWVIVYIVLVNIGDELSAMVNSAITVTSLLLIIFSVVLLWYVSKNHWRAYYGLHLPRKSDLQKTWFYLPLVVIALLQYAKGLKAGLTFLDVVNVIVLMIGVGFIEELLFRGFLYQGILKNGTLTRAVLISGITFGIGHIVNLARGYSLLDQGLQIAIGIALGIVLALLVAITNSIVPGVIFHTLLNISGNISNDNQTVEVLVVALSIVVCVIYALALKNQLTRHQEEPAFQK